MSTRKIKFIVNGVKWFDRVNGNMYRSVQVIRCSDGKKLYCPFQYGYGEQYQQTALEAMRDNGWIPKKYRNDVWKYERENNYPLYCVCRFDTKKVCTQHGGE